jgi:histidine ammonia-lyase
MGSISGRKALQVIDNVEKILAIELLTAAQAFEFRKPMKSGLLLDAVHKEIRKKVAFAEKDRVFANDIQIGIEMIKNKTIMDVIDKTKKKRKISFKTPFSNEFEVF